MRVYEFFATPEDGVIRIPEQYRDKITANVKVILLEEMPRKLIKTEVNEQYKSDLLLPPTMSTKGWKFNREEANER